MLRRRPEYLKVVISDNVNDIVDMAVFAYKKVMVEGGKTTYTYFDIWKSHKKFHSHFITAVCNICQMIYSSNPKIRLKSFEFMKVCADYFDVINEYWNKKFGDFKTFNVSSYISIEAFQDWCIKEYGSINEYLNSFKKKLDEQEEEIENKEQIEVVPHKNIKGLSEVIYE